MIDRRFPRAGRARLALALVAALVPLHADALCTEAVPPSLAVTDLPHPGVHRFIADDGRAVLFSGRRARDPESHRGLFLFDPVTGRVKLLTAPVAPVAGVGPGGRVDVAIEVAGLSADGRTAFQTYAGTLGYAGPNGSAPFLLTRSEPSWAIDTETGVRTPIASRVRSVAEAAGVPYLSVIESVSADGRYLLMTEAYGNGASVPYKRLTYRLDRLTGKSIDIEDAIAQADPTAVVSLPTLTGLSGDGRRVAVAGDAGYRLALPSRARAPGNEARILAEPYVYDFESGRLSRAYQFDIAQPRESLRGSSFGFLRNLGRRGLVYAFDRTAPIEGDPNPAGFARIGVALADDPRRIDILVLAQPWARGSFGTGYALVAEAEDRLYFVSSADLVGWNPQRSNQLFAVSIDGAELRQLTAFDDGLGRSTAAGSVAQTVLFAGASFDHSVVAISVQGFDPGGTAQRQANAAGIRREGTHEGPQVTTELNLRVYRCAE